MKKIMIAILFALLIAGCAHRIEIRDDDLKYGKSETRLYEMEAGKTYEAPMNGYFISDEGVQKILGAIRYFHDKWIGCEGRM